MSLQIILLLNIRLEKEISTKIIWTIYGSIGNSSIFIREVVRSNFWGLTPLIMFYVVLLRLSGKKSGQYPILSKSPSSQTLPGHSSLEFDVICHSITNNALK
jgi:hypothetical protein